MSAPKDGGPAFPSRRDKPYPSGGSYRDDRPGMTLRDYFAVKAMPAALLHTQRECEANGWPCGWRDGVAQEAYAMADAMLRARVSS